MLNCVTANLGTGKARREVRGDREYLVAPITMIVPGVLNGSKGPLLYTKREIGKNVDAWNGIPITDGHPRNSDGDPVSARSPGMVGRHLGAIYNASANGKLTAEAWFDVANTQRLAPGILKSLRQGLPIELSTGLGTEDEQAENGAHFQGRPFKAIARNLRPDHLAILQKERGACSVTDGCGVFNEELGQDVEITPALRDRLKKFLGGAIRYLTGNDDHKDYACTACAGKPDGEKCDECKRAADNAESFQDRQNEIQRLLTERFGQLSTLGTASGLWVSDLYDDSVVFSRDGIYYRLPYSETGGKFLLADSVPEKVDRKTEYVPTTNDRLDGFDEIVNAFCPGEGARDNSCGASGSGNKEPFSEVRDTGEETKGISGFPKTKMDQSQRFQGYVQGVGSKLFGSKHEAESWRADTLTARAKTAFDHSAASKAHAAAAQAHDESGSEKEAVRHAKASIEHQVKAATTSNVLSAKLNAVRSANTGRFKPYGSGTGRGIAHEWAQRGAMQLTERDRELGADAARQLAETGHNPASWVADEATWERAKTAAAKTYDEGDLAYWPAVAHIYRKMGGETKETNNESGNPDEILNEGDSPMKLNEKQRATIVNELATNCACWKGGEDTLNELSDERLLAMAKHRKECAANELVANAVREEIEIPDDLTANELPDFIKKKIAAKGEKPGDSADDAEPDDDEDDTMNVVNALRSGKRLTEKQFAAIAPAEYVERDKLAQRVLNREKRGIVDRLTANIADPKRRAAKTQALMGRDYESLVEMAELLPPTTNAVENEDKAPPVYLFGAGRRSSRTTINAEQAEEDVRDLTMPTLNIEPLALKGSASKKQTA